MRFRAAAIFGSHMVLQRNKNIRIFGYGEDGVDIMAQLAGKETVTKVL